MMSDDKKMCIVCTMPLVNKDDFPGGDTSLNYCKHCGTEDSIYPYSVLVEGMKDFLMESQGMDEKQAKIAAKEMIDNSEAVKQALVNKPE
ncbi:AraC family transcriptional regulator [Candidatus Dojkabacteria bacterium]|nr:AraC family transcriptional regulator [Candidatus Dojkabacteria bacterium]